MPVEQPSTTTEFGWENEIDQTLIADIEQISTDERFLYTENTCPLAEEVVGVSDSEITFSKRSLDALFELESVYAEASWAQMTGEAEMQLYLSAEAARKLHPDFFEIVEIENPEYIITARCDEKGQPIEIIDATLLVDHTWAVSEEVVINGFEHGESFSFGDTFRVSLDGKEHDSVDIYAESLGQFQPYLPFNDSVEVVERHTEKLQIIQSVATTGVSETRTQVLLTSEEPMAFHESETIYSLGGTNRTLHRALQDLLELCSLPEIQTDDIHAALEKLRKAAENMKDGDLMEGIDQLLTRYDTNPDNDVLVNESEQLLAAFEFHTYVEVDTTIQVILIEEIVGHFDHYGQVLKADGITAFSYDELIALLGSEKEITDPDGNDYFDYDAQPQAPQTIERKRVSEVVVLPKNTPESLMSVAPPSFESAPRQSEPVTTVSSPETPKVSPMLSLESTSVAPLELAPSFEQVAQLPKLTHFSAQVIDQSEVFSTEMERRGTSPDPTVLIEAIVRIDTPLINNPEREMVLPSSFLRIELSRTASQSPELSSTEVAEEGIHEVEPDQIVLYTKDVPLSGTEKQLFIVENIPTQVLEQSDKQPVSEITISGVIVPQYKISTTDVPVKQVEPAITHVTLEVLNKPRIAPDQTDEPLPEEYLETPLPEEIIRPATSTKYHREEQESSRETVQQERGLKEIAAPITGEEIDAAGVVLYSAPRAEQDKQQLHQITGIIEQALPRQTEEKPERRVRHSGNPGRSQNTHTGTPQPIQNTPKKSHPENKQVSAVKFAHAELPEEQVTTVDPGIRLFGMNQLSVVEQAKAQLRAKQLVAEMSANGSRLLPAEFTVIKEKTGFLLRLIEHQQATIRAAA